MHRKKKTRKIKGEDKDISEKKMDVKKVIDK